VIPALPGLTVIGTFDPLVAAVVVTAQESGRAGLLSLLGRIVHWRIAPIWYGASSWDRYCSCWPGWRWRWWPWAGSHRASGL
jgi:hypothetical protein